VCGVSFLLPAVWSLGYNCFYITVAVITFNNNIVVFTANGNVYDGQWCKGLKHGEGLYVFKEKGQYMEGVWIQGVPRVGVIKHLRHKRDVNEVVTIPHTLPKVIWN
jgi:hypothetical protein